jgi:branched-chain amino acid transport system ATP-binding protein
MEASLSVRGVEARYGDIQVLWGVSLRVDPGEVVALIGPNGAGKTTLLRLIAGLHPTASGSVMLGDVALNALPPYRIVEEGVILVPEGRRLFGGLTVLENLQLGAYSRRARPSRPRTLQHVFDLFPILFEKRSQSAHTLSGGQQQMLAIGRALMGLPRLLMLDEPSLGLAPMIVQNIFDILPKLNADGVTIFLVEQNARRALALAQRAYILEEGRVVGTGTGSDLLKDDRVREAYLGFTPAEAPTKP